MEVLIGNRAFANLIEDYMGPDARRYLDELCEGYEARERENDECYANGYEDGFADGQSR